MYVNIGGRGKVKCPRCDGYGTMEKKSACYYCIGRKEVECPVCGGTGMVDD